MTEPLITGLIEARGTTRRFRLDDGSVIERHGGTASWRNNNPGNLKLEYAGSADTTAHAKRSYSKTLDVARRTYRGVVALDQWGNVVFETAEAGRIAQLKLLRTTHGNDTVEQMVHSYSTADYSGATHHTEQIRAIYRSADASGSNLRGKTIAAMSSRELNALADGIGRFEGFKVGDVQMLSGPSQRFAAARQAQANIPAQAGRDMPTRAERRAPAPTFLPHTAHDVDGDRVASHHDAARHAQAPHLHASLHPGAHGARVRELQAALNRLGYGDAHGQRLLEDGHYGHHTRDAVAAFQAAHALPSAGVVGPRTQAALRHADAQLVNSPAHPDHRLFSRVLHQLHVAEVERGIAPGLHDERIAGALLVQMRRDGIEHVDRVEINREGSMVRAIWVSPLRDESGLNRASRAIDVQHAARQPLRASSDELHAGLAHAVQEHQLARQHSPPRPHAPVHA